MRKTSKIRYRATSAAISSAVFVLLLGSSQAHAQLDSVSREAATALAVAGLEAYEAGRYAEALEKLEKSYAVARVPTLALWSARALQKLGRLLEAEERYRKAIGLPLPEGDPVTQQKQQQALVDARAELAVLSPTIPNVTVEVEGARFDEIQLRIDGKRVSSNPIQRLDPGPHHLEASLGDAHRSLDLNLEAGDHRNVLLRFDPAPQAAAAPVERGTNWLNVSGWTALVLGGAGLALGTVGGVLALQKQDEMDGNEFCVKTTCRSSEQGLVDAYNARRTVAMIGWVGGGALAALGVGVLVLGGESEADPRAEAVISPGFTGIQGKF